MPELMWYADDGPREAGAGLLSAGTGDGEGEKSSDTNGVTLKAAWAFSILGVQGGKVDSKKDSRLRVVRLGRGLHRKALLVKSLQQQQSLSVTVRPGACSRHCYSAGSGAELVIQSLNEV